LYSTFHNTYRFKANIMYSFRQKQWSH